MKINRKISILVVVGIVSAIAYGAATRQTIGELPLELHGDIVTRAARPLIDYIRSNHLFTLERMLEAGKGDVVGYWYVSCSSDGTKIVTMNRESKITIWDVATGKALATVDELYVQVSVLNFDGTKMATASMDGMVKIWNVPQSGIRVVMSEPQYVFEGNAGEAANVEFNFDGTKIVAVGDQGTAHIWDVATGMLLHTLSGHTQEVLKAKFSGDGKKVATSSFDGTVKIWNVATGELLQTLVGDAEAGMDDVIFSPDGKMVAAADARAAVKIWNVATGVLLHTLVGHEQRVTSVNFSGDGKKIVTGSYDGTVKIWNVTTGELLQTMAGNADVLIDFVIFSPDGSAVIATDANRTVKICNVQTGICGQIMQAGDQSAIYSLDGRKIVIALGGGIIQIWNMQQAESFIKWIQYSSTADQRAYLAHKLNIPGAAPYNFSKGQVLLLFHNKGNIGFEQTMDNAQYNFLTETLGIKKPTAPTAPEVEITAEVEEEL